ncbi:tetracycline resistance MFS efflux pump [Roseibium aquae]|uniref:Tetracycline resistance MFS efflux pump n=1 Tax=Roseibium aquae TaxID=1323746 RepID=A0A916TMT9_9HYPH|nr:TCR/Tet family MFS transporter [Roseibium aquae]GGB57798.1 tetracycline resistance MFS efflux pump [Roseibium aquae]
MPPKRALIFIFATVALNTMGIGLILPVLPDLLTELTDAPLSEAAKWGGLISLAYASMQFLVGPTLGNLSDRFGRRPVLLVSQITLAVDYIIMALASSLAMLFVGRILSGIAGATISTASAFIADVSTKEDRTKNFGLIGAGFGIGFIFGPAIGGLLGEFGPRAPFYAAACLSFANFLLGYLVLPESLARENRRAFDWRRANPLGALLQIGKFPGVRLLLLSLFLFEVAEAVYPAIWAYYTQISFGWGPIENGASLAAVGLGFAFVQGYLIRVVEPKFGPAWTFFISQLANLLSFVGLAVIGAGWMVYALIPFAAFGSMTKAALTGLMANQIPDNAQGELQGLIYSVIGVSMMISPVLMTQTFAVFTAGDTPVYFPGAPFLIAASLIALSIIVCLMALQGQKRPAPFNPQG